MATNTPIETIEYYQGLLIAQYLGKPNASGFIGALAAMIIMPQTSVQNLSFSDLATSGSFVLSYDGVNTASINWNDSEATIQTKLRAVTGLGSVTVSGTVAAESIDITFIGVSAPALMLEQISNSLLATAIPITITIAEVDLILPLAVQDGFNLTLDSITAVGDQLDTIGKYVGVTRSGLGLFSNPITLDDTDFLSLIRMAIIKNSSGSSLKTIVDFLNEFFPSQILVYDSTRMFLTFVIASGVGSANLIQLFITEGILPVPMAVGYAVVYGPTSQYFGFRNYQRANTTSFPFNEYADYNLDWTWLSYNNVIKSS